MEKRVAILATGDEITNGDILNTNSQEISQRLFEKGILLGTHMAVSDCVSEIETAIHFLLQFHQAIIITGGLGPTSDDLTRYALANVLKKPLIEDPTTWNNIIQRIKNLGYQTLPSSNKQQALFPEGAAIIPNPHGTAAGCMLHHNNQWIFMLPGPPAECLPIINDMVIPTLITHHFPSLHLHKKWLLFGVSEGHIAEVLDAIAKPYECKTGYRICYPYIEFKIYSNNEKDFLTLVPKINDAVEQYIIEDGLLSSSEKLKQLLCSLSSPITIDDQATGGSLASTLLTPHTHNNLRFSRDNPSIIIKGLNEFWHRENTNTTNLEIIIHDKHIKAEIPLRGIRVKLYAVELICKEIYNYFK